MNSAATEQLSTHWQNVVNVIAGHYSVPVCLVMKVEQGQISVAVASEGAENPFTANSGGEPVEGSGLFCERVMRMQKQIQVTNAITDPSWDTNSVMKVGMVSYLGVPINWPDKSPFGTLCVLDKTEREFPEDFCALLNKLSYIFELELSLIDEIDRRTLAEAALRDAQKELLEHEKLKQLSNVSQGISHQLGSPVGVGITGSSHINMLCEQLDEALSLGNIKQAKSLQIEIKECNQLVSDELGHVTDLLNTLKKAAQDDGNNENYLINIVGAVQESWNRSCELHKVECQFLMSIDEACCISGREEILIEILQEIFSNSLIHSFNDESSPKVSIWGQVVGDNVMISVHDNGIGMSSTDLERADQPFFTKKNLSGNVGLGLNRIKKLVHSSLNGSLLINSDEAGTQVIIKLPYFKSE